MAVSGSTRRISTSTSFLWWTCVTHNETSAYLITGSCCLVVLVVSCSSCLVCSVELAVCPMQLFHFWSREVVQNLLLCRKFHRSWMIFHWDTAIQRFSKWRPSAILNCFTTIRDHPWSLCCWPQVPVKFHGNLIHRSEDVAIRIFCIFGLKCLFRSPKWGFGGFWTPKCDYLSSRPPKGTSLRKSASFKLSTVKIRRGVWPLGELTESVMDRHTQVNLYSVNA